MLNKKLKTLNRLDLFFILGGIIEVFCIVFITNNIYLMIIGVISIIPAYVALNGNNLKWNYFVGIWALVKYNPIGLIMLSFVVTDLTSKFNESIMYLTMALVFVVAISSFILGIIIIIKTVNYFKSQNIQNNS